MAQILGTVISAQITTGDTANTFSIGNTSEMQGGHHSVATLTDRDNISDERRLEGMTCYVTAIQKEYRLVGGTNNADWQEVTFSGTSSGSNGPISDAGEAAYIIAQEGTNTGTEALNRADAAMRVAQGAFDIAVIGTNTGTAALNAAAAAQSVADAAFSIAVEGTNLGQAAFDLAVAGTNAAANALSEGQSAFSIAVAGTDQAQIAYALAELGTNAAGTAQNSANAALNTAQGAFSIAVAGTNLASAAYALAELGTIIPPLSSLPDVSIPAPQAQQVLMFSGSHWFAGSVTAQASPVTFTYFLQDTASGTAGYFELVPFPASGTENLDAVSVTAALGEVFIEGYISDVLNRTQIDAGIWEFNTYGQVSNTGGTSQFIIRIFKRTISGSETELFNITSPDISSTTPILNTQITTQGSYATNITDKLVAKYSAITTRTLPTTVTLLHNGTAHYSHFHPPFIFAHNDLSGLQGGVNGQFYHVTLDQHNALIGTGAAPSNTNRFVTADTLAVEQGTRSQSVAFEAGTRLVSDTFLQGEIDVLNAALGISFLGTFTLYLGQVRGGQSDAQLTVINGVVTSQINPYYAWQDVLLCNDGSIGSFTGQSGWLNNGVIFTDSGSGIKAEDLFVTYTVGTINSVGGTLSSGTGWTASPTVIDAYIHTWGSEPFGAYVLGTVTSAGTLNQGLDWAGAPTINSI